LKDTICQIIALVTYGNRFLSAAQSTELPELFPTNSTFSRVSTVKFLVGPGTTPSHIITTVGEWYLHLKETGVKRLQVSVSPKEFSNHKDGLWGFYSGGEFPCAIRVDPKSEPEFWSPEWRRTATRPVLGERIWDVVYRTSNRSELVSLESVSPDEAASRLREALEEAREFASSAKLKDWLAVFEDALRRNNSTADDPANHSDLTPRDGCTKKAHQLLTSSLRSWVFGGMGWWNDLGPFLNPFTSKKYHKVSERLYSATLSGLVVGANNCAPCVRE
jgi:hypothetical protein